MGDSAQTPGLWVRAGAGPFYFSPECVKALRDAELNPDNFGTYAHVKEKATRASARCKAWDASTPEERRKGKMTPPTEEDRYLDSCVSGHLTQNGVHQRPPRGGGGVVRGYACHNETDGYNSFDAPSAPMERRPLNEASEDAVWGRAEQRQAREVQQAYAGRGQYDPEWRRRHENERLREYVERHPKRMKRFQKAVADQGGGSGVRASEPPLNACAKNDVREELRITHGRAKEEDRAFECLAAWREAMFQAMLDKCVANRKQNAEIAATPNFPNDDATVRAGSAVEAARRAEEEAEQQVQAETRRAQERRKRGESVPPPSLDQVHMASAEAHLEAERAERAYQERRGALCARDQADRISSNRPRTSGRTDL